jgi:hypothetical protein
VKSPRSVDPYRLAAAIAAAVFTFVLLFALGTLSQPDTPPSCPASRSGGVDIVSSGPRPCVLHTSAGSGAAPGSDGHATASGGSGKVSGGTVKQPKTPSAPKAPAAPKIPAAPAPKVAAPPPPVRR